MIFSVGDMVKRTFKDYSHMKGIVTKIVTNELKRSSRGKSQPHHTLMVRWFYPYWIPQDEAYWVEDLEIISKAKERGQ